MRDVYLEDLHNEADTLFQDKATAQEAYLPLLTHGWSHTVSTKGTQSFLAPDGHARVQHHYAWRAHLAWSAHGGMGEQRWQAKFSGSTPTTLVAAFTTSLISTEALRRQVRDVPFSSRHLLHVASATPEPKKATTPAGVATPPPGPTPGLTR
ncbi:hypothetical protein GCM10023220_00860 [Streptomyces ziwulingensis]|uniref:DUF317 domain-containing protein n=2 Tax=Streptomyces ziwulingensis TaxID=1045501 RepID=A0ABP9AK11_9ACTN